MYQRVTKTTAIYRRTRLLSTQHCTDREAGEVANKVKKIIRDDEHKNNERSGSRDIR